MTQRIVQVDAFTDQAFAGNPAAVCLMETAAEEKWMQAIAAEMNLSETAFLYPIADGYNLRWFTPTAEVELCGHATLATAHVLWEENHLAVDQIARFETKSGTLTAAKKENLIELDFPATIEKEATMPEGLSSVLGSPVKYVGRSNYDYLVELNSDEEVRKLTPDLSALAKLPVRGLIVTARSDDPKFDFISRMFAPAVGVPEDPVTGSAHCTLGPYWKWKLNKDKLTAYQASKRGGVIYLTVNGDRVKLAGHAVTVFSGELADVAFPKLM